MKKFGFILFAVLTIFAGFHFSASDTKASETQAKISGFVVDIEGEPIVNATVSLYLNGSLVRSTGSKFPLGDYQFLMGGQPGGTYTIVAIENLFSTGGTGHVTVDYQAGSAVQAPNIVIGGGPATE